VPLLRKYGSRLFQAETDGKRSNMTAKVIFELSTVGGQVALKPVSGITASSSSSHPHVSFSNE
jgi:hypothetical protein